MKGVNKMLEEKQKNNFRGFNFWVPLLFFMGLAVEFNIPYQNHRQRRYFSQNSIFPSQSGQTQMFT